MRGRSPQDSLLRTHFPNSSALMTPELEIIQLHRGRPPEERHRHLHLPLVGQDLLDGAVEVAERPLGDLDRLADEEGDLLLRTGIGLGLALAEEAVDLVLAQGHRLAAGADELDDALDRIDDRSEEHTSELQSRENLVCRLLLEKKNIGMSYT